MPKESFLSGHDPVLSKIISGHYSVLTVNTPPKVHMAVNVLEIDTNGHSTSIYTRDLFERDVPIHISSMSKQFFAAGLLSLIESSNGTRSLEDFVDDYIPSWPTYARAVKLKHLLNHSSGLPEYTRSLFTYLKNTNNPATVLRFVKGKKSLLQPPGTMMLYTNTNYVLIAYLIELMSSKPIARFMKDTFFDPLLMNNTFVRAVKSVKPKTIVCYYDMPGNNFLKAVPTMNDFMPGDGGVYTTLKDMQRWAVFLSGKSVLGAVVPNQMYEPIPLDSGITSTYGFGLHTKNTYVRHSGSWNGAESYCRFYKSRNQQPSVWFVALANSNYFNTSRMVELMKSSYDLAIMARGN